MFFQQCKTWKSQISIYFSLIISLWQSSISFFLSPSLSLSLNQRLMTHLISSYILHPPLSLSLSKSLFSLFLNSPLFLFLILFSCCTYSESTHNDFLFLFSKNKLFPFHSDYLLVKCIVV